MEDVTEVVKTGKDADGNEVTNADIRFLHAYFNPHETFTTFRFVGPNSRGEMVERFYTQEPLSVFLKEELGELLANFFEQFVNGEVGIDLRQIFQENTFKPAIAVPTNPEEVEALVGDDSTIQMIGGILTVLRKLPTLQKEIICIALGVPEGERKWATQILQGPVSRGGISDDQFEELIINFMKQNAKAIRLFFEERADRIATVFREEVLGQTETLEGTATEVETTEATEMEKPLEPDSTGTTPSSTTAVVSASTQEL